ncbi:MAG TPA: amino acid adenylation domain-containing protein [Thermoanaerobaculia bacterium]|nr:amino acid adenylation domain-containing protein [Thermoanaerobaculia bacterium]
MPLSLSHLLARAARLHPGRPALSSPGAAPLSYAELDRESARIAAALAGCGVRRGDRVGLAVPKCPQAVVALWGVLRAGAAYVPLDPGAPSARAAYIAADCRMAAILASSELCATIAAIREAVPEIRVVQVHGPGDPADMEALSPAALSGAAADPLSNRPYANARDLAYILYTSGSTGAPKGVMVSHGAALSFVEWAAWRFDLHPSDVLSSHAPLHFDLSTFDLFAAASAGAHVVVLDEETVRFPMSSAEALEAAGITIWYSVPGALRRMLRMGGLGRRRPRSLRTVLFAGESYPADELRDLQTALPGCSLFNLYGPTETNVCTYWEVPPAGTWAHSSIPIGIDCENCEGLVVDPDLKPVPDGTAGELLVRGGTLMEGYWGDNRRTSAAFLPDFLHPHLSDRFYRTGDIVSRQPDGTYAFHGRRDHQVKVRGYRVELGEVEAALHRVPGVVEAAVVAIERPLDAEPHTVLVAFVVGRDRESAQPVATHRLRRDLAAFLPKYMEPTEYVWLPCLPTTATGKVDRLALSAAAKGEPRFAP